MKTKADYSLFLVFSITVALAATNISVKACVPPKIEILSPTNTTYSTNIIPLCFTIDRCACWIGYSIDRQENVTIDGNTTLPSLSDGAHYVTVYANGTSEVMGASSTVHFAVDTTPPNITDISQEPPADNVLPDDEVKVNATITDDVSGVKQAALNYTNGNETWIAVQMANIEGNVWSATIPAFPYGTNVTYTIIAEDNVGNSVTSEEKGYQCQYSVIPELQSLVVVPLLIVATMFTVAARRKRRV